MKRTAAVCAVPATILGLAGASQARFANSDVGTSGFTGSITPLARGATPAPVLAQATIHVNPVCGDDSWTGLSAACAAPHGPKKSISAAVAAAATGDTVLLADGTYQGALNRNVEVPAGVEITIRSANGPAACVWKPAIIIPPWNEPDGRCLYIAHGQGPNMVVEGITFQESQLGNDFARSPLPEGDRGAAIFIRGDATIRNCLFRDNQAYWLGGAISIEGSPTITGCTFDRNRCWSYEGSSCKNGKGGAIYIVSGQPLISECIFVGNTAIGGGCTDTLYALGGAICSDGGGTISRCHFENNGARYGGGAVRAISATIVACTFTGNHADESGVAYGGIGGAAYLNTSTVDRCVFTGNSASSSESTAGGGLALDDSDVTNCLFVSNVVRGDPARGGAIAARTNSTVTNCTFVANGSTTPGIYCDFGGNWGRACGVDIHLASGSTVANSIVIDSIAAPGMFPINGSGTVSYSNIEDLASVVGPGVVLGPGNIDLDPRFAPGTFEPIAGAPGNDAGNNAGVPMGISLDLAGNARFVEDPMAPNMGFGTPPLVDMGAYEFQTGCYADCDTSTGVGVLDIFDFLCFQNRFSAGIAYACDCDTSTGPGVCDVLDFLCFQNAYAAGCP